MSQVDSVHPSNTHISSTRFVRTGGTGMSRNQRRGMPRSGRVAIVGVVATTFVLAACGGDGGDTAEGNDEEKEVTITLGTEFPPQQPASEAIDKAVELVDEYTNGTVTIEHFHS